MVFLLQGGSQVTMTAQTEYDIRLVKSQSVSGILEQVDHIFRLNKIDLIIYLSWWRYLLVNLLTSKNISELDRYYKCQLTTHVIVTGWNILFSGCNA